MDKMLTKGIQKITKLDPKIHFTLNEENDSVQFLTGSLSKPIPIETVQKEPYKAARRFIAEHRAIFGNIDAENSLSDEKARLDNQGRLHVVLSQKYDGIEVLGGMISIHFKADGSIYLVNSTINQHIKSSATAAIKLAEAQKIALQHAGRGASVFKNIPPALVIANDKNLGIKKFDLKTYHLCWKLYIEQDKAKDPAEWVYFIDASNGSVLSRYNQLNATGTGYYSTGAVFHSSHSGATHISRDVDTSAAWPVVTKPEIHTYDNAGSSDKTLANYREDVDDIWGDDILPPRENDERAIVDAHRYLGYILNYFYSTFNHNGWDNSGSHAISNVHYMLNYNNAFWSGQYDKILICDGDGVNYDYFCSLDILAHEFTHGVNHGFGVVQTYSGETGALNEALADSFGCIISLDYPAEDTQPWVNGDRTCIGVHPRSLADPARDAGGVVHYDATNNTTKYNSCAAGYFPDHYSIRYTGTGDYSGVHCNCPIVGHAVYLMVNGGTNRVSTINVPGIGVGPVEQMLYHTISAGLLTNLSNFADFRRAMINACQSLFPDNLDYLISVKTAFKAVGIGPDFYTRDNLGDTGQEPGTLSCMSPDIINRQQPADAATLAQIGDITNGSLCEKIELGQDNRVYFRVFNGGSSSASGTFRLYVSPASSFAAPASWNEVGHYNFPSIPAGSYWVPADADQCIVFPSALTVLLGEGHFCFIGIIESVDDPAPDHNEIHTITEFYDFIRKSNNYAWRNCDIKDDVTFNMEAFIEEFVLNAFEKGKLLTDIEIDARNLPGEADLVLLFPRDKIRGVKVMDIKHIQPRMNILRGPVIPLALAEKDIIAVQRPRVDFNVPEAELKSLLGKRKDELIEKFIPMKIKSQDIIRLVGCHIDSPDKIKFAVQFHKGCGTRDVHIAFRQLYKGQNLGQMNYIYKLRNK